MCQNAHKRILEIYKLRLKLFWMEAQLYVGIAEYGSTLCNITLFQLHFNGGIVNGYLNVLSGRVRATSP